MPTIDTPVHRRRLIRFGIPAAVIAFIVLCVAMCGPSNNAPTNTGKPTVTATAPKPAPPPPPPAPPPPPPAKDYVEGLVQSVSGGVIALRTRSGSATVDFSPQTRVVEQTPAELTDVTPGSCINVRATPQSARPPAAITAQSVTITPAVDGGECPPPAGYYGTVTSISGNTIAVNGLGPTPTTVTVTDSTTYNKQTPSSSDAIANGKCMGAQGSNEGGALQAMTIALQACPPMGRPHHHLHIPHLPIHLPFHRH
ncbi:DUF5666 domain-containing protein [Mycobacterium conspicuum]|jgi:hypothetical protein|uniref:DUF5666 domain-containing protein n=1 Tax=Mycobacterium conspicuum TaxID=44010 RepID=A0A1X1TDB4_9MYCO|nr:DUF5666 domain-containing protein [Mycobacterium conspicuum]ORV42563.1 hypothetical protein AWC00_11390 [Mycobacterium conspicuum]BBZ39113.1 hypothetical protein MCNS_21760 [Mycobacterium conspicuum]